MIFFACLTIFFAITTATAVYYLVKFGKIILDVQDTVEEALEVIDEKYDSINSICETPLFYDSQEVKSVLRDIKSTREALYDIAYALSDNFSKETEEDEG